MGSNITVGNSLLNLLTDFFVVVAVNQVMLCHCWFIVCLMNAWILSKGNSQRIQDVPSTKGSCEEGGNSGFNECEERCECRKGELTNCFRVRQDFTKMTIEQRKRFINTYKLASVHPLFKRDYEKSVTLHLDAKDQAKLPHIFLPWHRPVVFGWVWKPAAQNRLSCDYTLLGLEQKNASLVERIW